MPTNTGKIMIQRATVDEWLAWLNKELTPPLAEMASDPQGRYLLEALRDSLLIIKNGKSG